MKQLSVVLFFLLIMQAAFATDRSTSNTAYFAGGCFWCTESDFEKLEGVSEAISGYMGGKTARPNYASVSSGTTGHTETVKVTYDPTKISYAELVEYFWKTIDPLAVNAQFCDQGPQYRSAIFSHDEDELSIARSSKRRISELLGQPVATEVKKATNFTAAEINHQDYYKKNPIRYNYYRLGCGRDKRLKAIWGDKD